MTARLTAPTRSLAFGWSIALGYDEWQNSSIALISARRTGSPYAPDVGDDSPGSAYMYAYKANYWTLQQSFSYPGSTNFGNSVALQTDGSQFIIGGPSYQTNGKLDESLIILSSV
jgi:hypothetical protein